MRWLLVLAIVFTAGTAVAQPGQTPVLPPAYAYQPRVALSAGDQELLDIGEISDNQRAGGVAAAFFVGLGLGQLVEGRWSDTGWIFTFGELASVAAVVHGAAESLSTCGPGHGSMCGSNNAWLLGGMLALCTFRVWEVIDASVVPPRHNARLRALKVRMSTPSYGPYASAAAMGDGAVAGLAARF